MARYIKNPDNGSAIEGFRPDRSFNEYNLAVGETIEVNDRVADGLLERYKFLEEVDENEYNSQEATDEPTTSKKATKKKETAAKSGSKASTKKSDPEDKDNDLDDGEGGTEEKTVGDNLDDEDMNPDGVEDEPSTTVKEGDKL